MQQSQKSNFTWHSNLRSSMGICSKPAFGAGRVDEDNKVEVFSHEWTSLPASLFEPDPSLDKEGKMADCLAAIKTSIGSSWRVSGQTATIHKPPSPQMQICGLLWPANHFLFFTCEWIQHLIVAVICYTFCLLCSLALGESSQCLVSSLP